MVSHDDSKLNCIITGAGGFIGQALATALLTDPLLSRLTLTDVFKPNVPQTDPPSEVEIRSLEADLTSLETCQSLFTQDINLVYLFHGIMSGASEANLDLGLKVVRTFLRWPFPSDMRFESRDFLLPIHVIEFHLLPKKTKLTPNLLRTSTLRGRS